MQYKLNPWIFWGLGCLFYFYEFFLQASPSVMVPELMRDFSVDATVLGIFSSIYFWSYGAMQIPSGLLLDRFGPRKLLFAAALICALSAIAFSTSSHLSSALLTRFLIGFGSAAAAIGTMKIAANWFPPKRFALLAGFMLSVGMLGGLSSSKILAPLVENYGWRDSMLGFGVLGLILACAIGLIMRDSPKQHSQTNTTETESVKKSLATIVRNKQIWLVATYGGLMFLSTITFPELWGVEFLVTKFQISKTQAANSSMLVFIGWIVGAPLFGWFSDYIGKRVFPMKIATIGTLLSIVVVLYFPNISLFSTQLFLFIFGLFTSGFLIAFSIVREISSKQSTATALGFMNTLNTLGGAIAQPLVGKLLDTLWRGDTIEGVRYYVLADWNIALSLLPISILLALCLIPFIRETHCREVAS